MHLFYYQKNKSVDQLDDVPIADEESNGVTSSESILSRQNISNAVGSKESALELEDPDRGRISLQGSQESDVLEMQILQMQDDFFALQEDFRRLKDFLGKRIASLEKQLEKNQARSEKSESRVIFLEDEVAFYEQQTRMIVEHWKAEAARRDDQILFLDVRIKEKSQPHSANVERCDAGRHTELVKQYEELQREKLATDKKMTAAMLENTDMQCRLKVFEEQLAQKDRSENLEWTEVLERENASLRSQLQYLEQEHAARKSEDLVPKWAHRCIWKEQLDVRIAQLERLLSQLETTYASYHKSQDELKWKIKEADSMNRRLIDYEWQLREEQKKKRKLRHQLQQSDQILALLRQRRDESRKMTWRERIDEVRLETRSILESIRISPPGAERLEDEENHPDADAGEGEFTPKKVTVPSDLPTVGTDESRVNPRSSEEKKVDAAQTPKEKDTD